MADTIGKMNGTLKKIASVPVGGKGKSAGKGMDMDNKMNAGATNKSDKKVVDVDVNPKSKNIPDRSNPKPR